MHYSRDANPGSLTPSLHSEHGLGPWVFCFGAFPAQLLCPSKNILKDLLAESGERDRHVQRSVPGRWGTWTRVSGGGTKNYRLRLRVCHEEEVVEEGPRGGVQTPVQTLRVRREPPSLPTPSHPLTAHTEKGGASGLLHIHFLCTWNTLPPSSNTYLSFQSNLVCFLSWAPFVSTRPLPGPGPSSGLSLCLVLGCACHRAVVMLL